MEGVWYAVETASLPSGEPEVLSVLDVDWADCAPGSAAFAVGVQADRLGVLNDRGQWVIQPEYIGMGRCSSDASLWPIPVLGPTGYLYRGEGAEALQGLGPVEKASCFHDRFATIWRSGEWRVVDLEGATVLIGSDRLGVPRDGFVTERRGTGTALIHILTGQDIVVREKVFLVGEGAVVACDSVESGLACDFGALPLDGPGHGDGVAWVGPSLGWFGELRDGVLPASPSGAHEVGLLSRQGDWVVSPQFERMGRALGGATPALRDGRWSLVGSDGGQQADSDYKELRALECAGGFVASAADGDWHGIVGPDGARWIEIDRTELAPSWLPR